MSSEMVDIYDSTVSFTPEDGAAIQLRTQHGRKKPPFSQGEAVAVRYLPSKPEGSAELERLGRLSDMTTLALALLIPGLLFLLPAIATLLGRK